MRFLVNAGTFRSFGGFPGIGHLGTALSLHCPDFGHGLGEVVLNLYLPCRDPFEQQPGPTTGMPIHPSMISSYRQFHEEWCPSLPKSKLSPKKRTLELEVLAGFAHAEDLQLGRSPVLRSDWAAGAHALLAAELRRASGKLSKLEDFDVEGFLAWVDSSAALLPTTAEQVELQREEYSAVLSKARQQADPWDLLEEDWDAYHPSARKAVPDPHLWSRADDYAPNGNDTGADLLWEVQERGAALLADEGRSFLAERLAEVEPLMTAPGSQHGYLEREYVVGLAYALLKHHGYCPAWLRDRGLEVLAATLGRLEEEEGGGGARDPQAVELLRTSERVLRACPTDAPG